MLFLLDLKLISYRKYDLLPAPLKPYIHEDLNFRAYRHTDALIIDPQSTTISNPESMFHLYHVTEALLFQSSKGREEAESGVQAEWRQACAYQL